jgi:hypothetical protein
MQVLGEVLQDAGVQALRDERIGNHVREAGERQEVVWFARAEQGVAQLHAVQEVDVVVGGAVDN